MSVQLACSGPFARPPPSRRCLPLAAAICTTTWQIRPRSGDASRSRSQPCFAHIAIWRMRLADGEPDILNHPLAIRIQWPLQSRTNSSHDSCHWLCRWWCRISSAVWQLLVAVSARSALNPRLDCNMDVSNLQVIEHCAQRRNPFGKSYSKPILPTRSLTSALHPPPLRRSISIVNFTLATPHSAATSRLSCAGWYRTAG
jgi:hypothetical protein